jgi:hypothetical protein
MELLAGEVKKVIYLDSNPNLIYGIEVKTLESIPSTVTAKPLNINLLRVPIVGEIVLLLRAPSSYATGVRNSTDLYYLDIVSAQSSIHQNAIPTVSDFTVTSTIAGGNAADYNTAAAGHNPTPSQPTVDSNFTENELVKPLQPYVGDVLLQGRDGNSIRFSTTPKSGNFSAKQAWSGGKPASPITIIRNTVQAKDTKKSNDFVTENFTKDDNIIAMASGQILTFEQASKQLTAINSKNLTSWKSEKWGTTPQTLISSGRIVFNSTQKEIIAFAKKGIGLSSESNIALDAKNTIALQATKIELGNNAVQPVIRGTDFLNLLGTLTVITPVGPSAPLAASPQFAGLVNTLSKIVFTN